MKFNRHWPLLAITSALTILLACSHLPSTERKTAGGASSPFTDYVHGYTAAQYFQDNVTAFDARLKLIDHAVTGDHARIATFVYDDGKVAERLTRHLCRAALRGVDVEILVDSKSGDAIKGETPFNNTDPIKRVQEMYQYMANCGVKISIHNHLESYIDVFGQRMPNIFLDPKLDGGVYSGPSAKTFDTRIYTIITRVSSIVNDEFKAEKIPITANNVLNCLYGMAKAYLSMVGHSVKEEARNSPTVPDPTTGEPVTLLKRDQGQLKANYLSLINDAGWSKIDPEKLARALPKIIERVIADKEIGSLRESVHRFNRLNHRKLFLVESADRGDGCMILGGRNIGDHYLANGDTSFYDGDVMLCDHVSGEHAAMLAAANKSFEQLKTDLSDGLLGLSSDNKINVIQKNDGYQYTRFVQKERELADDDWADNGPILGEMSLPQASGWQLLTASWDKNPDAVAKALLEMINQENKEIFIESAYAEFNYPLRTALESKLKSGVRVTLYTNSFFTSDAGSKFIRILMAKWILLMQKGYPNLFTARFTNAASVHMTHFKGAGFACQGGTAVGMKSFLIGSHNFHPRSGRSDKEHALRWNQPTTTECTSGFSAADDLVGQRRNLYVQAKAKLGFSPLSQYSILYDELAEVDAAKSKNVTGQQKRLTAALKAVFYESEVKGKKPSLKYISTVNKILKLMDEGGLHDVIGYLF